MSAYININGKVTPLSDGGVRVDSRAFRYGYGLFETMLMIGGRIRLRELHWDRLQAGMVALGIDCSSHFMDEVKDAVARLAGKNGHEQLGRVRVQVWPGSGGLYDDVPFKAEYCIESFPLSEDVLELNKNGLVVGIAKGITKAYDTYSHIKTCSALPYAMASRQAKRERWNDALLLNQEGRIVDSTIANVFWIVDNKASTPPISDGCVAGVMRRHLLDALPGMGYGVVEESLGPQDIGKAEVIFLTNAIRGIKWVRECNGHELGQGMVAELVAKVLSSIET
jgi:branched-chain amino acid aminotransferase